MPTIKDVAKLAGVSFKTVSRVINNHPNVSAPVRQRVRQAITELDYRPNAVARDMRRQQSEFIGVITDRIITTPFSGAIIKGAQETAWQSEKLLMMVDTEGKPELAKAAVDMFLERKVAGIILATMFHMEVDPPANIREAPHVLVDCYAKDARMPAILPDEDQGGFDATEHLIKRGHERIALIDGPSEFPSSQGRMGGYRRALSQYGISPDDSLIRLSGWWQEHGYQEACHLLDRQDKPSAIFCGNDRIAMGVYDALRERNLEIPDDVAVMGFYNMEVIAAHLRPGLTTMELPYYAMGRRAIEFLTSAESRRAAGKMTVSCPLIIRAST